MKASKERKIIRWIHIVGGIPIIGLIYGPVKDFPNAVNAIQWVLFPLIVLSGFWLWQGHRVKKWAKKRKLLPGYGSTKSGPPGVAARSRSLVKAAPKADK